ncbi:DNA-methyltransferase [Clostridium tertium]|uniref:DNA-methyltransferase n=1 Tax=Clostridium tertium TaxID=1559 RepID=UPI0023B31968|nr:site-specific DNA-methyltransferase [Clostridium tertium]
MALTIELNSKFESKEFTLKEAYNAVPDKPKETVRARIYDGLGIYFERLGRGIYKAIKQNKQCLIMCRDGRKLEFLKDNTIDCIITDHPWEDDKSNVGGSRNFVETYETFKYTIEDFKEKSRVLKPGCFLVEVLPSENENNYKYLYDIKRMAEECGLVYYSKVPWKKGKFVANTGRKAKNTEDIMFFTKGKARSLRLDKKRTINDNEPAYMSGTNGILPTEFDVQSVSTKDRIHKSEKPLALWQQIIQFITRFGEVVLDQFAGSCKVGLAALTLGRNAIMIEKDINNIENAVERFSKSNVCVV